MKDNKAAIQRRHFLLTVGAGAAATAAVVAGKIMPSQRSAAKSPDKRRGKGYEETAHVRNYYRTTLV